MQAAIGYLRVSTQEQGRSGLGLAAQRHEIEAFGVREGSQLSPGTRMCKLALEQMLYCCDRGLRRLARKRKPTGAP
jgi:DNA invertase Pin-like site-specific DNA recombinase